MRCFTYYSELPDNDAKDEWALIHLWEESWARHGWTPIILSPACAQGEDEQIYHQITKSKELARGNFPTGYAHACHLRWLAHHAEGGLMTDYDVMNQGFTPDDLRKLLWQHGDKQPLFLSDHVCPCAVYATPDQCDMMLQMILDQDECPDHETGELKIVCHDQAIFAKFPAMFQTLLRPVCKQVPDAIKEGPQKTPLVHFGNSYTPKPRAAYIREWLKP